MVARTNANSPPTVLMKSRSLKHTSAPETQLIPWLAICGLVLMSERAKVPYLARQLSVFRVNTVRALICLKGLKAPVLSYPNGTILQACRVWSSVLRLT